MLRVGVVTTIVLCVCVGLLYYAFQSLENQIYQTVVTVLGQ